MASSQVKENQHIHKTAPTTISLASSHASPLLHPNEVAQLILDAANKLTKKGK